MKKYAIIIALHEEFDVALDVFEKFGTVFSERAQIVRDINKNRNRFKYRFDGYDGKKSAEIDLYLINRMGNMVSAAFVAASHDNDQLAMIFLVGISGALSTDLGLGDVVISNEVKYLAPDKVWQFDPTVFDVVDPSRRQALASALATSKSADPKSRRPDVRAALGRDDQESAPFLIDHRDIINDSLVVRNIRDHIYDAKTSDVIDEYMNLSSGRSSSLLETYGLGEPPKIARGCLLGSNWVVDSKHFSDYIVEKSVDYTLDYYYLNKLSEWSSRCVWDGASLAAVDMESYGFFLALEMMSKLDRGSAKVPGYAIRGISDLAHGKQAQDEADAKKETKKGASARAIATANAIRVALDMIDTDQRNVSRTFRSR